MIIVERFFFLLLRGFINIFKWKSTVQRTISIQETRAAIYILSKKKCCCISTDILTIFLTDVTCFGQNDLELRRVWKIPRNSVCAHYIILTILQKYIIELGIDYIPFTTLNGIFRQMMWPPSTCNLRQIRQYIYNVFIII